MHRAGTRYESAGGLQPSNLDEHVSCRAKVPCREEGYMCAAEERVSSASECVHYFYKPQTRIILHLYKALTVPHTPTPPLKPSYSPLVCAHALHAPIFTLKC